MFKIKKKVFRKEAHTIIGKETVITGSIQSKGSLRIDGLVKGDLNAERDIFIESSAEITGNVSANNISVGGAVEGNLTASGVIKILSTASLKGDISAGALIADQGGRFTGKCSMYQEPKKVLETVFEDLKKKDDNMVNVLANI